MYTNINRANTVRPLSSRPESQSLKNIIGLFNHNGQKQNFQIPELNREFGKDITNAKTLTEMGNAENTKQIFVKKRSENIKVKNYIRQQDDINFKPIRVENNIKVSSKSMISNKMTISHRQPTSYKSSENVIPNAFTGYIINNEIMAQHFIPENFDIDVNMKNEDIIIKEEIEDVPMLNALEEKILPRSNPQEVDEYFDDIVEYLREEDNKKRVDPNYMEHQDDINYKMRSILVDWLVDVHLKYKLVPETLFLTINIIDRYLNKVNTPRTELQLVGVAAMFIAGKYEDIFPPEAKEFAYITDKAFTKEQVIHMEKKILEDLDFDVTVVTSFRFLEIFKKMLKLNEDTFYYAWYLIELCLVDYKMLRFKPSEIAASACLIAWKMMKNWLLEDFEELTGYNEESLKECSKEICIYLQEEEKGKLHAVTEKFSLSKYRQVAKNKFL